MEDTDNAKLEQAITAWITSLGHTRAIAIKLTDVRRLESDIRTIGWKGPDVIEQIKQDIYDRSY